MAGFIALQRAVARVGTVVDAATALSVLGGRGILSSASAHGAVVALFHYARHRAPLIALLLVGTVLQGGDGRLTPMCGILGFVGPRAFGVELFGRALDVMVKRGPDDRGIYEEPEVLLGHRRLSIIDLSPAGHQPMASRDGRFVIVFNGEVYNFRELRRPLEKDVPFRSSSDTEVILELFAREGPACLDRFRGMFAIAIWDRLEQRLFLARDRMGIKPLYFWPRPQGIAFASEVKALRALPGGPSGVEPEALVQYLAWGSVPAPLTMTKGAESLLPATWLLWKRGAITRRTYWDFPVGADVAAVACNGRTLAADEHRPLRYLHNTRDEALKALRPLLREAVAYRCISDASLGAFLSGGIDSSSVVALMRAAGQRDLRTFSISFPQTALDEGPFAVKVAERFHTRHTDVSISADSAADNLDVFFAAMDQPTCDGFNTYMVSKFARQGGLTVSLSGLGGDEIFAGYGHHRRILRALPWLKTLPRLGVKAAAGGFAHLTQRYAKLEALTLPGPPLARLFYAARGLFMPTQIRALVDPNILAQTALGHGDGSSLLPSSLFPLTSSLSPFHALVALELRRYLHDQLLRDSDVFAMAHSLEIRVPLIDHRIVETIFQTAPAAVLGSSFTASLLPHPSFHPKALLLSALPEPLPYLCTHRPKMGFTFPFDRWMRGSWKASIDEQVAGLGGTTILNHPVVRQAWERYQRGSLHWSRPWTLLTLGRYHP